MTSAISRRTACLALSMGVVSDSMHARPGALGVPVAEASHRAQSPHPVVALSAVDRTALLAARERVWRAWFGNDRAALLELLPPETLAINAGDDAWQGRDAILEGAQAFAATKSRLADLRFPRTEIQVFGPVAVVYSQYEFDIDSPQGRETARGRATEVFVRDGARWVNPGWHLDSGR